MLEITFLAIACAILVIYLKSINSELYQLSLVASGIILISTSLSYLSATFDFFNKIIEMTGIEYSLYKIIFKITSIGYVIEFGAGTIEDLGLKSLADKLVFCGKIIIFSVSLPVLYAVFNVLTEILQ